MPHRQGYPRKGLSLITGKSLLLRRKDPHIGPHHSLPTNDGKIGRVSHIFKRPQEPPPTRIFLGELKVAIAKFGALCPQL